MYNFEFGNGRFEYSIIDGLLEHNSVCYYEDGNINIRLKELLNLNIDEYKVMLLDDKKNMLFFDLKKENDLLCSYLEIEKIEKLITENTKEFLYGYTII